MQIDDIRKLQANQTDRMPSPFYARPNLSSSADAAGMAGRSVDLSIGDTVTTVRRPGYNKDSLREDSLADDLAKENSQYTNAEAMKARLSMSAAGFDADVYEKAADDGYDPADMDDETFLTVTDKIKMQLLKGGADISKMGGLSVDELKAMSGGNAAYAAALEIREAGELPQDAKKYLITNELSPTIDNVYTALFSSASNSTGIDISEEELAQIMPQAEEILDAANLPADEEQKAGVAWMLSEDVAVTPENLDYLNRLNHEDLLVDEEDLLTTISAAVNEGRRPGEAYLLPGYSVEDKASDINRIVQGTTEDQLARLVEKQQPLTAENLGAEMLREERGLSEEPVDPEVMKSAEMIHARRVLEETRLVMTEEANRSLIRQGISVDTTELSELVEDLKAQENAFYRKTLAGAEEITGEALSERIDLFEQTNTQLDELKQLPAAALGMIPDANEATITSLHTAGQQSAARFAAAGERYEIMQTEIRRDLGDSIQKAFANVDDLLEEQGIEVTEANERAVRILGYNSLEITAESVAEMKAADEQVQRVFKNLTPGVVTRMIREGYNPLEHSFEELNEKAESIKAVTSADSSESDYAEFLWNAQQANELSEDERTAYIGMYRLMYQVEQTDGAAIGQLLHQGAELTLSNLMSAVRTRRHEGREYTVDDSFGFGEFDRNTLSITDQIEMAFQTGRMKDAKDLFTPEKMTRLNDTDYMSMSPDRFAGALEQLAASPETAAREEQASKDYAREQADAVRQAVESESKIYEVLERFDVPASPANLAAISEMMTHRNDMYRRLFKGNERAPFGEINEKAEDLDLTDVMNQVIEDFGEAVKTPEDMAKAQRNLEEIAENVMKTMIIETKVGDIDVKAMQQSIRQIQTMGEFGRKNETYAVPIMVADELGNMSLKIVRGKEQERGIVDIALGVESIGNIFATFRADASGITGTIEASRGETLRALAERTEEIQNKVAEAAGAEVSLALRQNTAADPNAVFDETPADFAVGTERPEVQTKTLYGIARAFIDVIGSTAV